VTTVFRGNAEVSPDSEYLGDDCMWIYYLCRDDGSIARIIVMDHTFATQGQ